MPEHVIPLDEPLPEPLVAEFAGRVFFAAEEIRDFRLIRRNGAVTAIAVTTPGTDLPPDLAGKLLYVLRNDVLSQLIREPKVIWRSPVHREPPADAFDELVELGAAYPVGEGQVALGEPVLGLMDDLDRVVRGIVLDEFAAAEYRYPTLIPTSVLRRFGYFASFPQQAMFTTRLRADADGYREFVAVAERAGELDERGELDDEILRRCAGVDYCLPPTMCHHTFNQFAGRRLPTGPFVVTSRGKSFRHEGRYHRSLARLWDFTIREIVFIGTRAQVLAGRERLLELTLRLMAELDAAGRCEVASDPFFGHPDSAAQASSQRLLESKYELRLDVAPGDSIAVASFNLHERHFVEAFDITLADGATSFSGCAGFGLERLAFALICQHGTDPARWPSGVRRALTDPMRRDPR